MDGKVEQAEKKAKEAKAEKAGFSSSFLKEFSFGHIMSGRSGGRRTCREGRVKTESQIEPEFDPLQERYMLLCRSFENQWNQACLMLPLLLLETSLIVRSSCR